MASESRKGTKRGQDPIRGRCGHLIRGLKSAVEPGPMCAPGGSGADPGPIRDRPGFDLGPRRGRSGSLDPAPPLDRPPAGPHEQTPPPQAHTMRTEIQKPECRRRQILPGARAAWSRPTTRHGHRRAMRLRARARCAAPCLWCVADTPVGRDDRARRPGVRGVRSVTGGRSVGPARRPECGGRAGGRTGPIGGMVGRTRPNSRSEPESGRCRQKFGGVSTEFGPPESTTLEFGGIPGPDPSAARPCSACLFIAPYKRNPAFFVGMRCMTWRPYTLTRRIHLSADCGARLSGEKAGA